MKRAIIIFCSLFLLLAVIPSLHAQKHKDPGKEIHKDLKKANKEVHKDIKKANKGNGNDFGHGHGNGHGHGKDIHKINKGFGKNVKHLNRDFSKGVRHWWKHLHAGNVAKRLTLSKSISRVELFVVDVFSKLTLLRQALEIDKKRLSPAAYNAKKLKIDFAEGKAKDLDIKIKNGKIKIK